MNTQTSLVFFMWIYPIFLVGTLARIIVSAKDRALYSILFAGLLLNFLGRIRFQVFHDPHGSFLLHTAGFSLLLISGIWGMARAFTQLKQRHA